MNFIHHQVFMKLGGDAFVHALQQNNRGLTLLKFNPATGKYEKYKQNILNYFLTMKKIFVLFFLSLSVITFSYSQENYGNIKVSNDSINVAAPTHSNDEDEIFVYVEVMPSFNGDVRSYLGNHIQVQKAGVQGQIVCQFVVNKDGSISDINVARGIDSILDKEVVQVIQNMPKWNSGMREGQPVRVRYTLPVNIKTLSPTDTTTGLSSLNELIIKAFKTPKQGVSFLENVDQYLAANAKYPETALEKGIQGRVVAQFWREEDGSISDIQITEGVSRELDSEVVRVIQNMSTKELPVREKYMLPVNFKIETVDVDNNDSSGKPDEMPSFKGNMDAYFDDHLKYDAVPKAGIQGRIVCRFMVNKDGYVSDVAVIHGIDPSLDKEVMHVIQNMPKWNPGKQQGEPVQTRYVLSIYFQSNNPNVTAIASFPSNEQYTIFTDAEVMPFFKGGNINVYLNNYIRYPYEAQKAGIEGRVVCQFTVGVDGSISDIEVLRKVRPDLDAEAVRVIRLMPKWNPGKRNGEPVQARYTLSVNFKLTK